MAHNCQHTCEHEDGICCANKVPIFQGLTDTELVKIAKLLGHVHYPKGTIIFMEGDLSDSVSIINTGQIKLFKNSRDGKQQILHILSEGDFFGELSVLQTQEYTTSAEAITDVDLCTLAKSDLDKIILEQPGIAVKVLEVIGSRLTKLENLVQNIGTQDTDVRIASMLLEFAQEGKDTVEGTVVELSLSREDMANYIGVTRETISRKLSSFQDQGLIKLIGNKKLVINDHQGLLNYVE